MGAKIWKKNAVLVTVILFVCVAVYLNWSYGRDDSEVIGENTTEDGQVSLVGTENTDALDAIYEDPTETAQTSDYFATARLTRQQARDSSLDLLRESAAMDNASQEVIDAAVSAINELTECAMTEAQIESLVIAKGFTDCVAFINDEGIDVVVSKAGDDGLFAEDVAQIKDIVTQESGISVEKIKIVEAQ